MATELVAARRYNTRRSSLAAAGAGSVADEPPHATSGAAHPLGDLQANLGAGAQRKRLRAAADDVAVAAIAAAAAVEAAVEATAAGAVEVRPRRASSKPPLAKRGVAVQGDIELLDVDDDNVDELLFGGSVLDSTLGPDAGPRIGPAEPASFVSSSSSSSSSSTLTSSSSSSFAQGAATQSAGTRCRTRASGTLPLSQATASQPPQQGPAPVCAVSASQLVTQAIGGLALGSTRAAGSHGTAFAAFAPADEVSVAAGHVGPLFVQPALPPPARPSTCAGAALPPAHPPPAAAARLLPTMQVPTGQELLLLQRMQEQQLQLHAHRQRLQAQGLQETRQRLAAGRAEAQRAMSAAFALSQGLGERAMGQAWPSMPFSEPAGPSAAAQRIAQQQQLAAQLAQQQQLLLLRSGPETDAGSQGPDTGSSRFWQAYSEQVNTSWRRREADPGLVAAAGYMRLQGDINGRMRAILIDWLVEVHLKFKLLPETLYLTVNLIDRFLSRRIVARTKLQLVGVTAMLLASKREEMYPPEVRDFVYITDNAYSAENIFALEEEMLRTLEFRLEAPTCYSFIPRLLRAVDSDERSREGRLCTYLTERMLQECDLLAHSPSKTAAAALNIALRCLRGPHAWTELAERASGYRQSELRELVGEIKDVVDMGAAAAASVAAAAAGAAGNGGGPAPQQPCLRAVLRKYSSPRYLEVASLALPPIE